MWKDPVSFFILHVSWIFLREPRKMPRISNKKGIYDELEVI